MSATDVELPEGQESAYTIFEGASETQRLVIARAISGLQIR